jgi:hypothetical protein
MTVPDEAVEAAAQRVWWEFEGRPWLHATDEMKDPYLYQVRLALTAAAPFIAAQAWDEGFKQGGPMHDVNYDDPDAHTRNPYRSGT